MKEVTAKLGQMKLCTVIATEVSRQCPEMPADERFNACINAANHVCQAFAMTSHEWNAVNESNSIQSIGSLLAQLRAQGCEITLAGMTVPHLSQDTRDYLRDLLTGVADDLRQRDPDVGIFGRDDMAAEMDAFLFWLEG